MYAPAVMVVWLIATSHALESHPLLQKLERHIQVRSALGEVDISSAHVKLLEVRALLEGRSPKGGKSGGSSGGPSIGSSDDDDDDSFSSGSSGGGGSNCISIPTTISGLNSPTATSISSTNCRDNEKVCVEGCIPTSATCCDKGTLSAYCRADERCVASTLVDDFYKCCPKDNLACDGDDFENSTMTEIANFRFGDISGDSSGGNAFEFSDACASDAVDFRAKLSLVGGALAAFGAFVAL